MRLLVAVLLVVPTVAFAQFKCTAPDGSVSFQQTPCASAQKQQALNIRAAPAPEPAPAPPRGDGTPQKPDGGGTVEQRMLRTMERDKRVANLEQGVIDLESAINNRNALMSAEMAALSNRKQTARNNLAGATYEQSISMEMQAVASKYKAMNDVDLERLKQLRSDLATARQQAATR